MVNQFGTAPTGGGGGGAGVQQIIATMTGMIPVTILSNLYGSYHVQVTGPTSGSPMFSCDVMKMQSGDDIYIKNVEATPAVDGCQIGVSWLPGDSLKIVKSLATHNGLYTITIVG